jgi:hypothetical protein
LHANKQSSQIKSHDLCGIPTILKEICIENLYQSFGLVHGVVEKTPNVVLKGVVSIIPNAAHIQIYLPSHVLVDFNMYINQHFTPSHMVVNNHLVNVVPMLHFTYINNNFIPTPNENIIIQKKLQSSNTNT